MTMIGDPIPMQFLPIADNTFETISDELAQAYDFQGYTAAPAGTGRMATLSTDRGPAGVLWGTEAAAGILPAAEMDQVGYTVAALLLRYSAHFDMKPADAFDQLIDYFENGPVIETDMADVHAYLDELDIDADVRPW